MRAVPLFSSALKQVGVALSTLTLLAFTPVAAQESRTVDTKFGAVTINGEPQRVVTLYEGALDASYAVDIEPLGAIITRGGTHVASYLQDHAKDITIVGTPQENNLEAIIALQPDLILAPNTLPEQQYQLLSAVAPTVTSPVRSVDENAWRQEARLFALALGKSEEMEQQITALEQRIAEVKAKVENTVPADQRTAMLARWMPQGPVILSTQIFTPSILKEVGFTVEDGGVVKEGRPHTAPISQENLSMLDKDWLFLATINAEGDEALAQAEKSPAYQRLNVVKNQRVIPVDGQIWTSANGVLAAEVILQGVESALQQAQ